MNRHESFLAGEYTSIEHITPEVYKDLKLAGVSDAQIIKSLSISSNTFYQHKAKHPSMKGLNLPRGKNSPAYKSQYEAEPIVKEPIAEKLTAYPEMTIEEKLRQRLTDILNELSDAHLEIDSLRAQVEEGQQRLSSINVPGDYAELRAKCQQLETRIKEFEEFEQNVHADNLVDATYHEEKVQAYNKVILGLIKIAEIDQ